MRFERIQVETRDDYRGAQEPIAFVWRDETHRVERVEDRWYEGYLDARRVPMRYYRVRTLSGRRFILRYHELFDAWSLRVPPKETSGP
ncbi:hypothetical protein SAMN02746041_01771 [Desulfacinum hydrothermale DSM 13146]|uniref:Uncharacterized protein n=1 Tax=Desulfacinum hydrothermale DSM 13146 TaxID=1121390 RepID=A0A1W1XHU1_9BACT|nr:hypothetical protein [Desulfacinum hydrothermale]SMC23576.1 hypothetical protein SAMN02746041_01771 [Desulfacinum hydrothermale DSM 13146]